MEVAKVQRIVQLLAQANIPDFLRRYAERLEQIVLVGLKQFPNNPSLLSALSGDELEYGVEHLQQTQLEMFREAVLTMADFCHYIEAQLPRWVAYPEMAEIEEIGNLAFGAARMLDDLMTPLVDGPLRATLLRQVSFAEDSSVEEFEEYWPIFRWLREALGHEYFLEEAHHALEMCYQMTEAGLEDGPERPTYH